MGGLLSSGLSAGGLRVSDIDAYWLQRSLSKFYPDANQSQRMSEEVLTILQVTDERECENGLVQSLGFDKFDFVKLLLRNRSVVSLSVCWQWHPQRIICLCGARSAKIAYITRLKQAQSDEERENIRTEMREDVAGGGAAILEALEKTQTAVNWAADRTGAYQTRVRKEAKALGGSGAASGPYELSQLVSTPSVCLPTSVACL
jgi:pre-mRNA-splicing helicase BRR2